MDIPLSETLSKLHEAFSLPTITARREDIDALQDDLYDALLTKPEKVPEAYFELQMRIARDRGEVITYIPSDIRNRMVRSVIEDQKTSLDEWISYLTANDAQYPAWYLYLIFTSVIKLSTFDHGRSVFRERTNTTVAPFPEIYPEPLARMYDDYVREFPNDVDQSSKSKEELTRTFPKEYAAYIEKLLSERNTYSSATEGEWKKYEQGNEEDLLQLVRSLAGKGTGWCTSVESTARIQLSLGDFYVYYTYDSSGKPSQPRIAIRMEDEQIGEIRGVLAHQELEPSMYDVLETKLNEFGTKGGEYKKRSHDMKMLSLLEQKVETSKDFTPEELTFTYEIDGPIASFGYRQDTSRIKKIRSTRNLQEDVPVMFECSPNEVAWSESEFNDRTQVYIGGLFPNIFTSSIKHIFTSFPDRKISPLEVLLGLKTKEELVSGLLEKSKNPRLRHLTTARNALAIIESEEVPVASSPTTIHTIALNLRDLGFTRQATTQEIYDKAKIFGLELCPAEAAPVLALSSPLKDSLNVICSVPLQYSSRTFLFSIETYEFEVLIASPETRWANQRTFVFQLPETTLIAV